MSISLPPLPLDKVDALRIAQDDKLRQGLRTARTTRADDAARSRAYMQALQPTLEILFTDLALVRPKLPLHFVAATAQDLASQCEIVDDASRDEIQQFLGLGLGLPTVLCFLLERFLPGLPCPHLSYPRSQHSLAPFTFSQPTSRRNDPSNPVAISRTFRSASRPPRPRQAMVRRWPTASACSAIRCRPRSAAWTRRCRSRSALCACSFSASWSAWPLTPMPIARRSRNQWPMHYNSEKRRKSRAPVNKPRVTGGDCFI